MVAHKGQMKVTDYMDTDNWATPPYLIKELVKSFGEMFDPCPYNPGILEFNGLLIEWKKLNFVNPPYTARSKEQFIRKAIQEKKKGNSSILLIPVSTSTKLFHDLILPNKKKIIFLRGRIPFIGINGKGEYVNWHLWDRPSPPNAIHVKASGTFDSMLVLL